MIQLRLFDTVPCSRCKHWLPKSSYYVRRARNRGNRRASLQSLCKTCSASTYKAWCLKKYVRKVAAST